MFVLPELFEGALRRERDRALARDLEQGRLVALLHAAASGCRRSLGDRVSGFFRRRPLDTRAAC